MDYDLLVRPLYPSERIGMADIPAELDSYRRTIDNLDAALVHILAERFRCTQQVGVLKAERELPASDPLREERQIARLRELAAQSGLDPVFAEKFFAFIVSEVIHHHEAIKDGAAAGVDLDDPAYRPYRS